MEFLLKITDFIQNLEKKQVKRYIAITLGCAVGIITLLMYYVYNQSAFLIANMKRIEKDAQKSLQLIQDAQKIKKQEDHILTILSKYENFDLQREFEQFCKEQNCSPEPGWGSSSEQINSKFNEETLSATFKNQTTEKMVTYLEALEKKEIIYIKGVVIKSEKDKKITFDILIATKKLR